ncbi:uncharacterized protein LY79DRAFT_678645 [Colletotrichum navitas]|uniref:Uncharacterized protein n=1 Tax=Colletotrichum navitas TaxID=681940 RepID=A0AAD8PLF7_9PEZI|nr:uncharacterized protein LY79DRAFT_678645 [Colletotrichum navitas]KAK1569921.1 hypothetical protein LY79DRAFT_678645 [Colletotrichum navitas]
MLISHILVHATFAIGALSTASHAPAEDSMATKTGGTDEVVNNATPYIISAVPNSTLLARDDVPPHDCEDILRRAITPEIDCSYSWENCGFDNHLEYRIRINAVGKTSPKWCEMMFHLVQRAINYHIRQEECDRTYRSNENGNGMVVVLTLPKPIAKFGEWRLRVEQAIKDNFCAGGPELTYWVNERCYRTSICRSRWWKRSLAELSGNLPEMMSPAREIEPAFFRHAAPITATTVSVEPTTTNIVPRDEPAPIIVNQAAMAADSGVHGKVGEDFGPVDKCPDHTDEQHACGSVDKSLISSVGVHCFYDRGQGENINQLDYKVTINPTGQNTACWCDRLLAAVRARCPQGQANWAYPLLKCNAEHMSNELGKGIHVNFHSNAWVAGKDNRECIKAAIESTNCGIATHFDRGGCFENH